MSNGNRNGVYTYFTEPSSPGGIGLCGDGADMQINIQKSSNPRFEVFDVPDEGDVDHWSDLVDLANEINQMFHERAETLLKRKREESKVGNLELTLRMHEQGLRIIYARPNPKGKRNATPVRSA